LRFRKRQERKREGENEGRRNGGRERRREGKEEEKRERGGGVTSVEMLTAPCKREPRAVISAASKLRIIVLVQFKKKEN